MTSADGLLAEDMVPPVDPVAVVVVCWAMRARRLRREHAEVLGEERLREVERKGRGDDGQREESMNVLRDGSPSNLAVRKV